MPKKYLVDSKTTFQLDIYKNGIGLTLDVSSGDSFVDINRSAVAHLVNTLKNDGWNIEVAQKLTTKIHGVDIPKFEGEK